MSEDLSDVLKEEGGRGDGVFARLFKDVADKWRVKPYVRVRDLNNGKDTNYDNEARPAVEAGIKITF